MINSNEWPALLDKKKGKTKWHSKNKGILPGKKQVHISFEFSPWHYVNMKANLTPAREKHRKAPSYA